ncbi:maleylacetoacetate isomerase [Roseinatronobacter sp.]|uniref:maleylacetoacetate isomerase n=1 Tax=Roseinatronobacter sp. TaxID=1945755 RepID=UPI0025FC5D8D|nr:maleylacetoacetate isomerase [Rhodobaca sp.]
MIRLYEYWRSSSSYRVRIGLNPLGLAYESVQVELTNGEQTTAENLARNPQGIVPTLEIDGHRLTQSLAILEYLEERFAPGWLPDCAQERARVRALAMAVAMEIQPVCNIRVAKAAVAASCGAYSLESWMRDHIGPGLVAVEKLLDHPHAGRFCHGDTVSLADICLLPQVYNARRWGVDMSQFTRISRIEAEMLALDAVKMAHPDACARV